MGLSGIKPAEFQQVRRLIRGAVNSLINQHHYLGYCHPVGEHLKNKLMNFIHSSLTDSGRNAESLIVSLTIYLSFV
jgi:hypothetical protein